MKTVVTLTGIRPDFIRMSNIFKLLDDNFNHILIHSGQHYDQLLSSVFFEELNIRKPDYQLSTGYKSSNHYEQLSYLSVEVIKLLEKEKINPDMILFLGDSNSVCTALPLKKEGYKIGHIEAGMRSGDKRMLEEINRTVCDHCSDILFVYHEDYKYNLSRENITNNVFVVGNTILEVAQQFIPKEPKTNQAILIDIHRPENFKYKNRLQNIIKFSNYCSEQYHMPIYMLSFPRTCQYLKEFDIDLQNVQLIDLLPFKKYLNKAYHCLFVISDSGTAQEELAILKTPALIPRDYTERPQSVESECSYMINMNKEFDPTWYKSLKWVDAKPKMDIKWLGKGNTAEEVISHLKSYLN